MQTTGREKILSEIATVHPAGFQDTANRIFAYQKQENRLFGRYLELLGDKGMQPFLPVSFFKTHDIKSGVWQEETYFESSGTTGQVSSRHPVRNLKHYLENARRGFAQFYGDPSEWCFLALLPNYLERGHSSLVAMADYFIRLSPFPQSGFFLHDLEKLQQQLLECQQTGMKTLLLGVSFALLDFAEQYPMSLQGITVMETGGMKGRRKEMTRAELHSELSRAFGVPAIHSEYGMTELFSQAYAQGGSIFAPAPTLRAVATEVYDPFCVLPHEKTGVLNFLDLANVDTLSFIQTEDLGRVYADGRFEVLGRLDAAEWRGCNLLII